MRGNLAQIKSTTILTAKLIALDGVIDETEGFELTLSIDGGDHITHIWKNPSGITKITIQGTGDAVTVLEAAL